MGGGRPLGEWAVLGLLAEAPAHPFALSRLLQADGPIGRVLTVRRPLVYRAVDRLAADGLVEADRTEPGDAGPERTVYRVTARGRAALDAWLEEPVDHVRDLRLGFLLKASLLERAARPVAPLAAAQRRALAGALAAVQDDDGAADAAALWRCHSAAAADRFLAQLSEEPA